MAKVQLEAILKLIDVDINPNVFRKISQAVAGLPASVNRTAGALGGANTQAQNFNRTLNNTRQNLSNNERAARLFLQRMSQFAILLPTFATLNHAIQGGVKFLFDFDSALRDIVRVDVGNLAGRMEEIGDSALQTALDFGVLAKEVLEVTKIFVQAGLSIEESQERARLAILASQVSTLSSADAIEFFIASTNQFKLSSEELRLALDGLVKVEDLAAVEAQDVADAFRTGGNSLAVFGKDINDAIGIISALREQTRKSGNEIGTFLKTLQTRIFAAGESRSALEGLGVAVENIDGSLRPTLDVLTDLKTKFDQLTEAQQANAAKAIAGVRQFEELLGVMASIDRANELATKSSRAAGAAEEKRRITDEKLERQIGKLIAQGQALAEALGDAGLTDLLSDALGFAQKLLSVFTGMAQAASDVGLNLAPLLALGGVVLGKSIFGLSGKGGQGGPPQPGSPGFVGPTLPQQSTFAPLIEQSKRLGIIFKEGTLAAGNFSKQLLTGLKISSAHGVQVISNTQSLKVHTSAVSTNAKAMLASAAASAQQARFGISSTTALAGLTLVASYLPTVFGEIQKAAGELPGDLGKTASMFTQTAGEAATLAAQFAFLGPQAAALAATFALVKGTFVQVFDAFQDEQKALGEQSALSASQGRTAGAELRLQGGGRLGEQALDDFFTSLSEGVKGKNFGNELNEAISESFKTAAASEGFKDLNLSLEEFRDAALGDIAVLSTAISKRRDLIQATAEDNERVDEFTSLMQGLEDGTLNTGEAFGLLVKVLGAGEVELAEFAQGFKRVLDFEEFKKAQEVIDLTDSIRQLGLEMEIAKLGPDAMADSIVRLKNELLIAERGAESASQSIRDRLGRAIGNLGVQIFDEEKLSPNAFIAKLFEATENLDVQKIEEFKNVIRELPNTTREAAEEVLKLIEDDAKNQLDIQKQRNDVAEAIGEQSRKAVEDEAEAKLNALEVTERFTAELRNFGDAVDTQVLAAVQNLSLGDVESVLAGKSDLSEGLQQLIKSALGSDVERAQAKLAGVSADTAANLNILEAKLSDVSRQIDIARSAEEKASLETEKRSILLDIEKAEQDGAVKSTEAKIDVLKAERDAAKDAAEAAKKHQEALDKLADVSRKFENELRDINRGFDEFIEKRTAELMSDEADALEELKDAQQESLEATKELDEAYEGLIDAYFQVNNAVAEAQIKSNLLARDIALLTGEIFDFDGELSALQGAFTEVLGEANITLEKRIELERQLAEETLTFLQQAQQEITQAGLNVFGQSGAENQALSQGIAGLQLVADKLGGSFEAFLNMNSADFATISQELLALPVEFRQQILDALSALPGSVSIGGFNVDQLTQALGQVGAGVAPEEGLPSIEELNSQQVEQLKRLQEITLQEAQLQFSQVAKAEEQIELAQEQLDAAKILEERAVDNLEQVRDAILEEQAVLEAANVERAELLSQVIEADNKNTLLQIEKEAQLFADQNVVFREIGNQIVQGITSAIGGKIAIIEAQNALNAATGHVPNFSRGSLTPREAAGLLRAGMREKRAMPSGAGLAVANTSEAIIPMHGGHIPNFQSGNVSPIAAGIDAIRNVNESVVAAISRSITEALATLDNGQAQGQALDQIASLLTGVQGELEDINASSAATSTAVAANAATGATPAATPTAAAQQINVSVQTNQNSEVRVVGIDALREQLAAAVRETTLQQVEAVLTPVLAQVDAALQVLRERNLLTSFGQPG